MLGEGRESAKINGGPNDYRQCHSEGFNEQNKVRQDYGQQDSASLGGGRPTPGGGMDGSTDYGTHSETVHFNAAGQITGITYN